MNTRTSVAVCVITFRRPKLLARLLTVLASLTFHKAPEPDVKIIVVDNDPDGAGREICDAHRATLRWPLVYAIEPRRGIPAARNRCIELAGPETRWIAFIDDDEWPESQWLDELLDTQRRFDADVVAGPVLGTLSSDSPEWIREGRFFQPLRRATGRAIDKFGTGNVLLRHETLRTVGLFEERMALAGGSDTQLAMRLQAEGCRMVWSDEAVAYEQVPPTRMSAAWLLQRAYREGNTISLCERSLLAGSTARAMRAAKGLGRIVRGLGRMPVSVVRGRAGVVASLREVCRGAGMLTGLMGRVYEEYQMIHGS